MELLYGITIEKSNVYDDALYLHARTTKNLPTFEISAVEAGAAFSYQFNIPGFGETYFNFSQDELILNCLKNCVTPQN